MLESEIKDLEKNAEFESQKKILNYQYESMSKIKINNEIDQSQMFQ